MQTILDFRYQSHFCWYQEVLFVISSSHIFILFWPVLLDYLIENVQMWPTFSHNTFTTSFDRSDRLFQQSYWNLLPSVICEQKVNVHLSQKTSNFIHKYKSCRTRYRGISVWPENYQMVIFAEVADSYIKISASLIQLANIDPGPLDKFLTKVADVFEKARVISLVLMWSSCWIYCTVLESRK